MDNNSDQSKSLIWLPLEIMFENGIVGTTVTDDFFTLKATTTAAKEILTISDSMEEIKFQGENVILTTSKRYQVGLPRKVLLNLTKKIISRVCRSKKLMSWHIHNGTL